MTKRKRVQYSDKSPSMTQQHMKEQTNVNSIVEKYRRTGSFNHLTTSPGQYGDFSQFRDFRESMNQVIAAQQAFDGLPAHLRKRFSNDPANLVEFLDNPQNLNEAEKLGIMTIKPQVEKTSASNDDKTTINSAPQTSQA
ncbi:internal scaffolding protein [Apis mellifera associated microvirus 28]|nr:internal scaffolding protein [Apis mellifera associated microvirus 28]